MDLSCLREHSSFNSSIEKENLMKSMNILKNNSKISNVISINRKKKSKKMRKKEN